MWSVANTWTQIKQRWSRHETNLQMIWGQWELSDDMDTYFWAIACLSRSAAVCGFRLACAISNFYFAVHGRDKYVQNPLGGSSTARNYDRGPALVAEFSWWRMNWNRNVGENGRGPVKVLREVFDVVRIDSRVEWRTTQLLDICLVGRVFKLVSFGDCQRTSNCGLTNVCDGLSAEKNVKREDERFSQIVWDFMKASQPEQ